MRCCSVSVQSDEVQNVQVSGVQAIGALVGDGDNRDKLLAYSACEMVVAAMQRREGDGGARLQWAGAEALLRMLRQSPDTAPVLRAAGAREATAAAIVAHVNNDRVRAPCVRLLQALE
jgi:hypothetical protein